MSKNKKQGRDFEIEWNEAREHLLELRARRDHLISAINLEIERAKIKVLYLALKCDQKSDTL